MFGDKSNESIYGLFHEEENFGYDEINLFEQITVKWVAVVKFGLNSGSTGEASVSE